MLFFAYAAAATRALLPPACHRAAPLCHAPIIYASAADAAAARFFASDVDADDYAPPRRRCYAPPRFRLRDAAIFAAPATPPPIAYFCAIFFDFRVPPCCQHCRVSACCRCQAGQPISLLPRRAASAQHGASRYHTPAMTLPHFALPPMPPAALSRRYFSRYADAD